MNNCLIILNARNIPECIESFESLAIDKAWFTGFTEVQLVNPINDFIKDTNYDNYLIASDDLVISQGTLNIVEELLETNDRATAYCKIADDSIFYNVSKSPLAEAEVRKPVTRDYHFYKIEELDELEDDNFESWFGGWTLTGMRKEEWLKHPFRVHHLSQMQSDYATCLDINAPFACHKDAICVHVRKNQFKLNLDQFIIGKVKPSIRTDEIYNDSNLTEFDATNMVFALSSVSITSSIRGGCSSGGVCDSGFRVPDIPEDITPVLHERMFPDMWFPGINQNSGQNIGLVTAMPMWERTGWIIQDVSGNRNHATITNYGDGTVGWTKDNFFGDALTVIPDPTNGASNQHTVIADYDPSMDVESGGFTVSIFARLGQDIYQGDEQWLASRYGGVITPSSGWGLKFVGDSAGVHVEFQWRAGGSLKEVKTADDTVEVGKWYHVIALVKPSSSTTNGYTTEIYLNGISKSLTGLTTSDLDTISPNNQTSSDLYIGAQPDSTYGTNWFFGNLKDFRFYNYALIASQINEIKNQPELLYEYPITRKIKQDAVIYTETVSGGILAAGVADEDLIGSVFAPSGGSQVAGSADISVTYNPENAEGVSVGGSGDLVFVCNPAISGGIIGGGGADIAFVIYIAGVFVGGASGITATYDIVASGGVECSGRAEEPGGITIGGEAEIKVIFVAQGGVEDDGNANPQSVYNFQNFTEPEGAETLGRAEVEKVIPCRTLQYYYGDSRFTQKVKGAAVANITLCLQGGNVPTNRQQGTRAKCYCRYPKKR